MAEQWLDVPTEEKAAYCYHVAPFVDALNTALRESGVPAQAEVDDDLRPYLHALVDAARRALAAAPAAGRLSFAAFRRHNLARCEAVYHPVGEWSETDWMTAVAGEVGEAANMVKKRRRGDGPSAEVVGKEIADAVTYLDLLAYRLGLEDLGTLAAGKFDEVSERIGWDGPRLAALRPAGEEASDE